MTPPEGEQPTEGLSVQQGAAALLDLPPVTGQEDEPAPQKEGDDKPEPKVDDDDADLEALAALDEHSDEDEADKEEGDDVEQEDEGTADDDDVTDDDEAKPELVTIVVDGKEEQVTQDELKAGYQRQASTTRKAQALAEERRAFEAEQTETRAQRDRYAKEVAAILAQQKAANVDWEKLKEEDPDAYAVKWADHQRHQEQVASAKAELDRITAEQQSEQAAQADAYVADQQVKLREAIPELKEASTGKKLVADLMTYGEGMGFTEDEINRVADHRLIVLLDKARKHDALVERLTAVREKRAESHKKPAKPNASTPRKRNRRHVDAEKALQRLQETGSLKDGVHALMSLPDETGE